MSLGFPSRVITNTFLILPPRVKISACTVFSCRDCRVCLRSARRSARSSQERDALIEKLPELAASPYTSTLTSSASDGTERPLLVSIALLFSFFTWVITSASNAALSNWNGKITYFSLSRELTFLKKSFISNSLVGGSKVFSWYKVMKTKNNTKINKQLKNYSVLGSHKAGQYMRNSKGGNAYST